MAVASPPFTGFSPEAIQFLADLAANNDRAWFQPRKADYERLLKEPMEALVAALAERSRRVASRCRPTRSARSSGSTATLASARTSRRTRRTSARASRGSNAWLAGPTAPMRNGGYFHFQPGEMYVGGGMWMAEKPRSTPSAGRSSTSPTASARPSRSPGSSRSSAGAHARELKRVPPGLPAGPPDGRLLPLEGHRVRAPSVPTTRCSRRTLPDTIADGYAAAMPVFRFLSTLSG